MLNKNKKGKMLNKKGQNIELKRGKMLNEEKRGQNVE